MWKDFFALSRNEQRAFFLLLGLLFLVFALVIIVRATTSDGMTVTVLSRGQIVDGDGFDGKNGGKKVFRLVPFDPNRVTIKELEQMGVGARDILVWKKYIEAGGRFKSADDLRKMYGIDSSTVNRIHQYIVVPSGAGVDRRPDGHGKKRWQAILDLNNDSPDEMRLAGVDDRLVDSIMSRRLTVWFTRRFSVDELTVGRIDSSLQLMARASSAKRIKKEALEYKIELNVADSSELDLLNGIGPAYARRIVWYRQRIGGFCNIEQLLEVEGISPDLLEKIKPNIKVDASKVVPINVNIASIRKLKEHPYLGFYRAKDIIDLRKQKGPIQTLAQVFSMHSFKDANKDLLSVYLATQ